MESMVALAARLAAAFQRLTASASLAASRWRAFSRRHGAEVRRLRELFDNGDFENALRHAIPVAPVAAEAATQRSGSRRGPAARLSAELQGELRRLYRDGFQRLETQGRVEEAAFLLAEVLHADEEAVAFLERHGRLRLAAEMAEARDLPPGLVIRQWFLAGDRQRGLRIAHRTGAYADAVTHLERGRQKGQAAELRRLWARAQAAAGNYAAAVDILWSLPEERPGTLEWIDRAIGQGGAPAGRMLARKAALAPELSREVRGPALELPLAPRRPWIIRREPWKIEIAARDTGTVAAHDAALLPNGLTAVALGEAGVRLLSRDGNPVADLDQPAHRLVVADHGDRAIALARRGDAWRLARLDFTTRRAEPWCEARLDAFAPDYDGSLWFTVGAEGLLAVDAGAPRLEGSWGLSRLPGSAVAIARSASALSLVLAGETPEIWTYELPSLTLRRRDSLAPGAGRRGALSVAVSPAGTVAETWDGAAPALALYPRRSSIPISASGTAGQPVAAEDWAALPVHTAAGIAVHLTHLPSTALVATVELRRAARVTLRLTAQDLTLADDRGRVLVLDLKQGRVRRDFRV